MNEKSINQIHKQKQKVGRVRELRKRENIETHSRTETNLIFACFSFIIYCFVCLLPLNRTTRPPPFFQLQIYNYVSIILPAIFLCLPCLLVPFLLILIQYLYRLRYQVSQLLFARIALQLEYYRFQVLLLLWLGLSQLVG